MSESTQQMPSFGAGTAHIPYSQPRGTRNDAGQRVTRPDFDEPAGLAEWLGTPEASQFVGRWVLLTRDYEVLDYASRPSELLDRHPDNRSPFIVFVRSRNIRSAR
jgi:hypothetical protein